MLHELGINKVLDFVFARADQSCKAKTYSVSLRRCLALVEVEGCASPLAFVFLDFAAFFLASKPTQFLDVGSRVAAANGEQSCASLLPVPALGTEVKGSKNCLAFSN